MRDNAPWILGLASSHNGGACLLHGDHIVAAVQEERLARTKRADHRPSYASLAVDYCLAAGAIGPSDLACIVTSTWRDNTRLDEDVRSNPVLRPAFHHVPTHQIGHHLAHAIGVFATSGFREAAVLVVDGNGSPLPNLNASERAAVKPSQLVRCEGADPSSIMETVSLYEASGTSLVPLEKHVAVPALRTGAGMPYFWSLGHLYSSVGRQIFDDPLDGPGKVMGLAPFGAPEYPWSDFFEILDGDFVFRTDVPDRFPHDDRWPAHRREYENLAASAQAAIEHGVMTLVTRLRSRSPQKHLCYAGGVALNCITNERIVRESGFEDVYIMPAAEDSGTAIGAAYYGLWAMTGRNTYAHLRHDSVGRPYTPAEIRAAITSAPVVLKSRKSDLADVARAIASGHIVGWFQGRSELGPRALGQRSILCDPRRPEMKEILNSRVKGREAFRPFAPVVLEEAVAEWFDVPPRHPRSPHMLRVMPVRSDKRHLLAAVTHVDGTGRVQTVSLANNGALYEIVRHFGELTGVPVLLNTSFNRAGQPIVETPEDALLCFLTTGIDLCVLDEYAVAKPAANRSMLDLFVELTAEWVIVEAPVATGRIELAPARPPSHAVSRIWSSHADADRLLNRFASAHRLTHTRLVSSTRWGRLVTVAPPQVAAVLECVDGNKTGRELMGELDAAGLRYSEQELTNLLLRLHEVAIVAFRHLPVDESVKAACATADESCNARLVGVDVEPS